ncbi:MAG: regulatory protein RecX [Christensenellales bacterium]|jgi:regulatory protein
MIKIVSVVKAGKMKDITDSDGNKFKLTDDICYIYGVMPGKEYGEDEINEMRVKSDTDYGMNYAIDYMSKGIKTVKEVKDKLYLKKLLQAATDNIINRLTELDYLNDERYAVEYVNYYSGEKGSLRLRNELKLKGVDRQFIDKALDKANDYEACLHTAEKFIKGKNIVLDRDKLVRHLLYRGFMYDTINEVIARLGGDYDIQDI